MQINQHILFLVYRWTFIFAIQAQQVFYLNDTKYGSNWKVVQVVQNKWIWDVPTKLEDVESEQLGLLKVLGGYCANEDIERDTFCRVDIDSTSMEWLVISHIDDYFINDDEKQLSHQNRSNDDDEQFDLNDDHD